MSTFRVLPLVLLAIALAACSSSRRARPARSPHLGTDASPAHRGPTGGAPTRDGSARSTELDGDEGLGTVYGERRRSDSFERRFERARVHPDAVLALCYDDYEGVAAVSDSPWQTSAIQDVGRHVTVSLVDGRGRVLDALDVGRQRYAVGEPGRRYEIEVTNRSSRRYEVVASVDGLDVIDGEHASTRKRGYILEPHATLVIDGWRTHEDEVAAFRFGQVADSYAARRGAPMDIGVIGVALFAERPRYHRDTDRRRRARPFDDRFAPPPS